MSVSTCHRRDRRSCGKIAFRFARRSQLVGTLCSSCQGYENEMTSTAWNPRNSSQFGQQGDAKLSSGRTLSKNPSNSRAGRSSSLFSFGSSKKTSSPQITPFTPNIPSSTDTQQASMEQNQNSNDPVRSLFSPESPVHTVALTSVS